MDYQDAFAHSWDLVEASYISVVGYPNGASCKPVLDLVREMRRRGYDRLFRAGMAAFSLVLSRSAKHGLRREQPFVQIFVWPFPEPFPMRLWCGPGEGTRFTEETFAVTPALERVLADLAKAPID